MLVRPGQAVDVKDLLMALRYARERLDDAIKVVVKTRGHVALNRVAAE